VSPLLGDAQAPDLHRVLADLAEAVEGQLIELYARPAVDRAERVALTLEGARLHVLRLRERLITEGEGHER
jgi:hypothetical protein